MSTSYPVLQSAKISPQTGSWTILVKFCGPRRWRTMASTINSRSGWMLHPQVLNNIIWGPSTTPSHQNTRLLVLKWLLLKEDICCNEQIPNMNKTNTEPKTNWNQMQTTGWPNPSNLYGALSMMTMQGARGRASTGDGSKWRWSNNWWRELMVLY
jgi:hypothetical protein